MRPRHMVRHTPKCDCASCAAPKLHALIDAADSIIIPISAFNVHKGEMTHTRPASDMPRYSVRPLQEWTLTAEASDLAAYKLQDIAASKSRSFVVTGVRADIVFVHLTTDMNGEDVAGWWFHPAYGQEQILDQAAVKILIIND